MLDNKSLDTFAIIIFNILKTIFVCYQIFCYLFIFCYLLINKFVKSVSLFDTNQILLLQWHLPFLWQLNPQLISETYINVGDNDLSTHSNFMYIYHTSIWFCSTSVPNHFYHTRHSSISVIKTYSLLFLKIMS